MPVAPESISYQGHIFLPPQIRTSFTSVHAAVPVLMPKSRQQPTAYGMRLAMGGCSAESARTLFRIAKENKPEAGLQAQLDTAVSQKHRHSASTSEKS